MVMNQQMASSTAGPTVSRPWLRRMAALLLAEGVGDALALLDVVHDAGVVVEQGVVLEEDAGVLGDGVEQAAEAWRTPSRAWSGSGRRPCTSGRAACTCEWMAKAALFTGQSPSTTSPWWLTRIRSDAGSA